MIRPPINQEEIAAIDEYVTTRMRAARIPGLALGIVKGDRIVYLKGYGRADPAGRPVTPQTPFIIGSITKSFTALAVLQLVEAGLSRGTAQVLCPRWRSSGTEPSPTRETRPYGQK